MNIGEQKVKIDISTRTIVKFFLILLGLVFLYLMRDIIVLLFIVLVFVAALSPIVDRWAKEMPRSLAVIFLYLIIILLLTAIGLLIVPPLVEQVTQFASNLPEYLKFISPTLESVRSLTNESQKTLLTLSSQLSNFGLNLLSTTLGFFGGLAAALTVFVMSFYLLIDKEAAWKFFDSFIPAGQKESVVSVVNKITDKMGAWLRSQLSLMVIVGTLDFIGLLIIGIPFPLALGVWAGLTEIIPYIGPFLGAVPAVIIALSISPIKALLVVILFVVVQQIEAQFLVPKIMGKAVGLRPVVVILALLIGVKLAGILGVLLSVPVAAALSVIIQEYPKLKDSLQKP